MDLTAKSVSYSLNSVMNSFKGYNISIIVTNVLRVLCLDVRAALVRIDS